MALGPYPNDPGRCARRRAAASTPWPLSCQFGCSVARLSGGHPTPAPRTWPAGDRGSGTIAQRQMSSRGDSVLMQSSADQTRVFRVFERAMDLAAPARAHWLDTECGADRALRADVDALLARNG